MLREIAQCVVFCFFLLLPHKAVYVATEESFGFKAGLLVVHSKASIVSHICLHVLS